MKKITVFIFLFIYICSSFCTFASDSLYYDDFNAYSVGTRPDGLTVSASGTSKIYVDKADVDGEEKNVLKIEHNSSITSVIKKVDSLKQVSAEIRFRRLNEGETEHPSMVLVARNSEKEVFRIYANSKDNRVVINSSLGITPLLLPSNPKEIYIEDNVWNTIGLYVDTVNHKAGFKLKTDTLKGMKLVDNVNIKYDTNEGIAVGEGIDIDPLIDSIDDIRIFTGSGYTGIYEIDYIKVDNKNIPFELIKEKPVPLELPLTSSAGERLIPDKMNVVVDNTVCYYPLYPFTKGNILYAEYKKTFEALGFSAFLNEEKIIAYDDYSEITLEYKTGKLNIDGNTVNISPASFNEEYIMVPVKELTQVLGFNTRISDNAVYISKNELFGLEMSPYTFKGKSGIDGDDNIYIFHFGQRDNKFEEVGIEIKGKKYSAKSFDDNTGTKFGIGIADPLNKLKETYTVKPYCGNNYGISVEVNKNTSLNAVFHPVYSKNYYPESKLSYLGAYTTEKDYSDFKEVPASDKVVKAIGRPGGDEYYRKSLMKFDLNSLEGLSRGRRVYLYLTVFGTNAIVSDKATLEVYGAKTENYDELNPPVRDELSGPVGKALIDKSVFTGLRDDAVRIGIDVTSYIQEKIYENASTVTFFFKIADFELASGSDSANLGIYFNHDFHGTDNSNKLGNLYNPELHITGTYNNIDSTVYPEVTFSKVGKDGMWYGSNLFTSREGSGYTEVNCPTNGLDNSSRLGLLQFSIPDDFTGVTKGKKIILDFYAYRASSCSSDIVLETVGTYNEVVMTESGMDTYHIRSFEEGLLHSDILGIDKQKITVDITDYVISKYLEGNKQFTIAFRTKYPEGITGTSNSHAYIHTVSANEEFRPQIRYE